MTYTASYPTFSEWQLCPVCVGHGVVEGGFFEIPAGVTGWAASTTADTCRVCGGKGIIQRPVAKSEE